MSRYDIRGMQDSGMSQQQINDYIKQQDAKIYGPRGGMGPKQKVDTTPPLGAIVPKRLSTPKQYKKNAEATYKQMQQQYQLANSVGKPQIIAEVMPDIRSIPRTKPSVPDYLKPGYTGLPAISAPITQEKTQAATNPIPQSILGIKKKGGEVKKYVKGGKINLDACGVSTGGKSNKCAGW